MFPPIHLWLIHSFTLLLLPRMTGSCMSQIHRGQKSLSSSILELLYLCLGVSCVLANQQYKLADNYVGDKFFDDFDWFTVRLAVT